MNNEVNTREVLKDSTTQKEKKWIYLVFFLMGIISFPIGFILSISLRSMNNLELIWQLLLFPLLICSIFFAIGLAAFKKQPQAYYSLKAFVASFAGVFLIIVMVWSNSIMGLYFIIVPQQEASTSASIYLESNAENFTIYVPVLLDENKTVLKMYGTPAIRGNSSKVTTAITDIEYGEALQIRRSGLDYLFNWDDVPGNDTGRFVKWLEYRGFTEQGDKLDIKKTDNGDTLTAYVSRAGYAKAIEYTYRINEKKVLESTRLETGFFAKEENGKLNIYSGDIGISMNEKHGVLKEDDQTSDEFFRRFTISMSNYTSPESFVKPPQYPESFSMIGAWVYSDTEIEKISFDFYLDPKNRNNSIALSISTQGWVHLNKGWQVVNLSKGINYGT
ncbi:MAG: hypothetical protein J5U19_07325 [Candidatus Methanoperedens sp.]|nr:hypothetical protein [Candidatus Methanoperedens sp.]